MKPDQEDHIKELLNKGNKVRKEIELERKKMKWKTGNLKSLTK